MSETEDFNPKILVITTLKCSDPGADFVGQSRLEYSPNATILRTQDPSVFPEEFYFYCWEQGFDGVIVMSGGTDTPFKGAYESLSKTIDSVYVMMQERGIEIGRLRLTAICSVCAEAFIKEMGRITEAVKPLGTVKI
jgi:coenzyme F420-reducing hydrogenase delta subunit